MTEQHGQQAEQQVDAATLALARLGAAVARRWWVANDGYEAGNGFIILDCHGTGTVADALDEMAVDAGVMASPYAPNCDPRPGIAEAVGRLTGGDA